MDNQSTSGIISTGLLAYGMSGKVFHAPFIETHPGFKLSAIVQRTKELAQLDYPEIKSYATIEDILADKTIDLIIVNTPNYLHYEHSKMALTAGKHILVEKPFTATTKEAQEIFAVGKSLGLKVMVYQNRRYSSDFISTKKVIESGKLGKIIEVHLRFDRYKPEIGPKSFKETPFPASGIVYDLGAHLIDQAISVFGKPTRFNKTTATYRKDGSVPDFGSIQLSYPGPLNVFITVSLHVADPQKAIVVHGTEGSFTKCFADMQEAQSIAGLLPTNPNFGIEEGNMEGTLTMFDSNNERIQTSIPGEKGNMMGIFEAAFQTIKLGKDFPVTEAEILAQMEILEKV